MFQEHLTTEFVIAEVLAFMLGAILMTIVWERASRKAHKVATALRERLVQADARDLKAQLAMQDLKHTLAYGYLWRLPSVSEARNAWKGILTGGDDARRIMGVTIITMTGIGETGEAVLMRGRLVDNVEQFAAFVNGEDGLMAIDSDHATFPVNMATEDLIPWQGNIMDAYLMLLDYVIESQQYLVKTAAVPQDTRGKIMIPQADTNMPSKERIAHKVNTARGPIEVDSPFPVDRKPMGATEPPQAVVETNGETEVIPASTSHEEARMEAEGGIVLPTDDEVAVANGHEPIAKSTPTTIPVTHVTQAEAIAADNDSRTHSVTLKPSPTVHLVAGSKRVPRNTQDS